MVVKLILAKNITKVVLNSQKKGNLEKNKDINYFRKSKNEKWLLNINEKKEMALGKFQA